MKFVKHSRYWGYPLYKRAFLSATYWFRGLWMFLRCLRDARETIHGNELGILITWSLCQSVQEARFGKVYRVIFDERR